MATKGRLDLKGLSDYLETLAAAGEDVDAAAQEILLEAAPKVSQEMRRLVPKDTLNLNNHIGIDGPHQDGNFLYVNVGVLNADKDTAIYGNVQEFGSARVQAQPYIRPAMRIARRVIKKVLESVLLRMGASK